MIGPFRAVALFPIVVELAACADMGGSRPDQVRDAQGQWELALQRFDYNALNRLLSDTYVQTDLRGKVEDRVSWLDYIKPFVDAVHAGQAHFDISFTDEKVRVYEGAAVVTGAATFMGNMKAQAIDNHIRFTNVWVTERGVWRLASYQATILEPRK